MTATARIQELTVARRAMACEFSVVFPHGVRRAVDAGCAALDEVERLEQKLSVYQDDSDVSYLNGCAAEAPVRVDAETYSVLRLAVVLSRATGGAFDAATGALVKAWGFYRGPQRVPSTSERTEALAVCGSGHVVINDAERTEGFERRGVEFNLGGIGKGFAIDRALGRMNAKFQVRRALMQGGQSSLRAMGAWEVEIGDPMRPGRAVARVWLRDRALGTSGADHQFFVKDGHRYGHILDPRTGWPACGVLSASAVARTAAEADALSTAFFVLGLEGTRRFCAAHAGVAAVLVLPGPKVEVFGDSDVEVLV
jgi:FAD:protein FMN transferase